ncbi:FAD-dependent oxidoreductase [Ginsengibacter hankyongi]|uniref:FAD-dependent oxidoreductase n=1 Tax=Ginsengibacter hankyongi TaxID=2607284 RepID=A0A5J5I9W3_9BACT|nr:FAD-dependent oxidoreductase [Ginsengibacter hankyongi]KAA9034544.1 FAD-dependent oxidoreductase [Ginsengibacter hankyongi]
MQRDGATISLWQHNIPDYVSQTHSLPEITYDVLIVGGGITGISTGLLLQKAGKKCLIAEAATIGFGTTGGTTAHLNNFMDSPYSEIAKNFGEDNAQLVCTAANNAIGLIKKNIADYNINCDFSEQKGYLFSQGEKQDKELDEIYEASLKAGCHVIYSGSIPLPVTFRKAVLFENQAQFHSTKYLYGIAKAFEDAGGTLLQGCRITNVKDGESLEVTSDRGTIRAKALIYATHVPPGVNILHFRCAPYRSYAMAIKLANDNYPANLAYDMYDPYHYYRTQEVDGEKYLIAGGEDHKTGHVENTNMCFTKLESYLRGYFNIESIPFKWSSQYYQPVDGLPYIGHLPGNPSNVYVATGYGGNGITYSHVAARVLTDILVKGSSEYEKLFSPARVKPMAGFEDFIKESADVVAKLIGGLFPSPKMEELADMAHGEAKVVKYQGQSIALFKDEGGKVHAVNPACTHIDCQVSWNNAERSWDCPCHGSRFNGDGKMLTAPARKDLEKIELK